LISLNIFFSRLTSSSFLGIQGIYPTGNFCKSYQSNIKKGTKNKAGIIALNVSMLSFVANQETPIG
jgi:hypothetical protein